jgi:hypothetical protein
MKRRGAKHLNLYLNDVEARQLRELGALFDLRQTELLRRLLQQKHDELRAYLAEHPLEPGQRLRLRADGRMEPYAALNYHLASLLPHIPGAVVLGFYSAEELRRMAKRAGMRQDELLRRLISWAAGPDAWPGPDPMKHWGSSDGKGNHQSEG